MNLLELSLIPVPKINPGAEKWIKDTPRSGVVYPHRRLRGQYWDYIQWPLFLKRKEEAGTQVFIIILFQNYEIEEERIAKDSISTF